MEDTVYVSLFDITGFVLGLAFMLTSVIRFMLQAVDDEHTVKTELTAKDFQGVPTLGGPYRSPGVPVKSKQDIGMVIRLCTAMSQHTHDLERLKLALLSNEMNAEQVGIKLRSLSIELGSIACMPFREAKPDVTAP